MPNSEDTEIYVTKCIGDACCYVRNYCTNYGQARFIACVTDGYININIIKNVSRRKFVSLLPYYMKGTIFTKKKAENIISTEKCTNITVTPNGGNMRICIDGEITDAGKTEFEILHNAFDFVIPGKIVNISANNVSTKC